MRAAIYTRKSQKQSGVADEDKSVAIQEEGARAWIAKQGWQLVEVYEDDGVSGALFATRESFSRMLRDAEAGIFDCVVLFDLDRFGRDSRKTMEALHDLDDLGISVWDYTTGQVVDLSSFGGRITTNLRAEFGQEYRDSIRKKVRASHAAGAKKGKPKALVPFGYKNTRLPEEPKKKLITIVPEEAQLVGQIYAGYAAREGLHGIVRWLNASTTRRGHRWNAVTVRRILHNPIYRGELVWGRSVMNYKWPKTKIVTKGKDAGKRKEKGQLPVPEDKWIRVKVPDLKIIDDAVLARVDLRLRESRELYLKSQCAAAIRRAPHKAHGKHLLSGGLLLCPSCGGHFEGTKSGSSWRGRGVYLCSARKHKPGSCTNRLVLDMDEMDALVLHQLEDEVLSPRYIESLAALVDDSPDDREQLLAQRNQLEKEKGNLVRSVAKGIPVEDIAPLLKELNGKIAKLDAATRRPRPVNMGRAKIRAALEQTAAEWKEILRGEPRIARPLIQRIIGPITLWEEEEVIVPEHLKKYVGLPPHLIPKTHHWSHVPGDIPAPNAPVPTLRWKAETKPEVMLGELSAPSGTLMYTHVLNRGGRGVKSPLDALGTTPCE
jgi:DNA invertase Pin-like site-specific DNA recombinase